LDKKWPFVERPLLACTPSTGAAAVFRQFTSGRLALRDAHFHPTNFAFTIQAKDYQQCTGNWEYYSVGYAQTGRSNYFGFQGGV